MQVASLTHASPIAPSAAIPPLRFDTGRQTVQQKNPIPWNKTAFFRHSLRSPAKDLLFSASSGAKIQSDPNRRRLLTENDVIYDEKYLL